MCLEFIDNEAEILEQMPELVECYKALHSYRYLYVNEPLVSAFMYEPAKGKTWAECLDVWLEATNMGTVNDGGDVGIYAFMKLEDAKNIDPSSTLVFSTFMHKKDIIQIGKWDDKLALQASRAIVRTTSLPSGIVMPEKENSHTLCAKELLK